MDLGNILASGVQIDLLSQVSLIPGAEIPGFGDVGRAFVDGKFTWNHILLYGLYLIKFILGAAGITAIIGIMEGGYAYIFGTFTESKEKGKDRIKHTLIGFVLVILAWAIVDIVVVLVTSG